MDLLLQIPISRNRLIEMEGHFWQNCRDVLDQAGGGATAGVPLSSSTLCTDVCTDYIVIGSQTFTKAHLLVLFL